MSFPPKIIWTQALHIYACISHLFCCTPVEFPGHKTCKILGSCWLTLVPVDWAHKDKIRGDTKIKIKIWGVPSSRVSPGHLTSGGPLQSISWNLRAHTTQYLSRLRSSLQQLPDKQNTPRNCVLFNVQCALPPSLCTERYEFSCMSSDKAHVRAILLPLHCTCPHLFKKRSTTVCRSV